MKRRLILHAGTPKTGTSALQVAFDTARERLRDAGILYPRTGLLSASEPKHQWLVRTLRKDLRSEFVELIASVESECDERIHTIVLSTEGLYGSWDGFGACARGCLVELGHTYDVCWWLWLRDPAAYLESYYVQSLWNPQSSTRPEWSRDLDVLEFLNLPRIAEQLDYRTRCREMESVFGMGSLYAFAYSRTIVRDAFALLGVAPPADEEERVNVTIAREIGVRVLRAVNRYPLDGEAKAAANESIRALIGIAGERSPPFALSETERARARAACSLSLDEIARLGAQSLARWKAR